MICSIFVYFLDFLLLVDYAFINVNYKGLIVRINSSELIAASCVHFK